MSVPPFDYSAIKYFTCSWTGLASMLDTSADTDDLPDLDGLTGNIIATPTAAMPLLFTGSQPFTLVLAKRIIPVNGSVMDQGRTYFALESSDSTPAFWYWRIKFDVFYKGISAEIPDAVVMAGAGDKIDITNYLGWTQADASFIDNPAGKTIFKDGGSFYYSTDATPGPASVVQKDANGYYVEVP